MVRGPGGPSAAGGSIPAKQSLAATTHEDPVVVEERADQAQPQQQRRPQRRDSSGTTPPRRQSTQGHPGSAAASPQRGQHGTPSPSQRVKRVGGGYELLEDTLLPADARGRAPAAPFVPSPARPATAAATPAAAPRPPTRVPRPGPPPQPTAPHACGRRSCSPSDQELEVVREMILVAEEQARRDFDRGASGSRDLSLIKLLRAYEEVLPRHGVVAEEDTHYYRILLRLSLDPEPNWWRKFDKEAAAARARREGGASGPPADATFVRQSPARPGPAPVLLRASADAAGPHQPSCSWQQQQKLEGRPRDDGADAAAAAAGGQWQGDQQGRDRARTASPPAQVVHADAPSPWGFLTGGWSERRIPGPGRVTGVARSAGSSGSPAVRAPVSGLVRGGRHSPDFVMGATVAEAALRPLSPAAQRGLVVACTPVRPASAVSPRERYGRFGVGALAAGCASPFPASSRAHLRSRSCSPTLVRAPLQQQQQQFWGERPRDTEPARERSCHTSRLTGAAPRPLAADYSSPAATRIALLSALLPPAASMEKERRDCEDYAAFKRRLGLFAVWREHARAANEMSNPELRAIARWRLAMSFWEVHAARRCLRRWRLYARLLRLGEQEDISSRLLAHTFGWWRSMVLHYRRGRELGEEGLQVEAAARGFAAWAERSSGGEHGSSGQQPCAAVATALEEWVGGRLRAAFCGWRRACADRRAAVAQARGPDWHTRASAALGAWHICTRVRREDAKLGEQLAWHHITHTQAAAWHAWRSALEARCPRMRLLRSAYARRARGTMRRAMAAWRVWAPQARAKRRRQRDALAAMARWRRSRVWVLMREYTAARREVRQLKAAANAHFRRTRLHQALALWARALELQASREATAAAFAAAATFHRACAGLRWWRTWRAHREQKREWRAQVDGHMVAGVRVRVLTAWRSRVDRRHRLEELESLARLATLRVLARAALRGWWDRVGIVATWREATEAIAVRRLYSVMSEALGAWRAYAAGRRRDREAYSELVTRDVLRVCRGAWGTWAAALGRRRKLRSARAALAAGTARRALVHWKARVDFAADWRAFEAAAVARLKKQRLAAWTAGWQRAAGRRAMLRRKQQQMTVTRLARQQDDCFAAWRAWLQHRVRKRVKALSALLHWERGLTHRAVTAWITRTAGWRTKRQQRVRADAYRAAHLLGMGLTAWTSHWAEGHELRQRGAFLREARRQRLLKGMTPAWGDETRRLQLKRQHQQMADVYCTVSRLDGSFKAWRAEAARRVQLRARLVSALLHWSNLTVSRAFGWWKEWALSRAHLHRRAKGFLAVLMGKEVAWSFFMLRENALRKRRTRAARIAFARRRLAACLAAWRHRAAAGRSFRAVMAAAGSSIRRELMSDAFEAWGSRVGVRRQKQARMMRALMVWGGSRKQLCFAAWRQYTGARNAKSRHLARAVAHWTDSYSTRGFNAWRAFVARRRLARLAVGRLSARSLAAAFSAWRSWSTRRRGLAAAEVELRLRARRQMLCEAWAAWREFAPQQRAERDLTFRAQHHWEGGLLAKGFWSWHAGAAGRAARREALTDALMHWRARTLREALTAWRGLVGRWEWKERRVATAGGWRRERLLGSAFGGWRLYAARKASKRATLASLVSHWRGNVAAGAVRHWRGVAARNTALRDAFDIGHARWVLRQLRSTWDTWVQNAELARRGRAFARGARRRVLALALDGWQLGAAAQRQKRLAAELAGRHAEDALLRRGWAAWRETMGVREQLLSTALAARARSQRTTLWRAFSALRVHAVRSRMARMAVARWSSTKVARSFEAWRAQAAYGAHIRAGALELLMRVQRRLAALVLRGWLEEAWLGPRERHADAHRERQLARAALDAWLHRRSHTRRLVALHTAISSRWVTTQTAAAFGAWRGITAARVAQRAAEGRAAARWRNLHLAAAFSAWRGEAARAAQREVVTQTITLRWQSIHMSTGLAAWKELLAERRMHRVAAEVLAARVAARVRAEAFREWREHTVDIAARRAAAEGAASQKQAVMVAAALAAWREDARYRAALRQRAARVDGQVRRGALARMFAQWHAAAHAGARRRAAAAAVSARCTGLMLASCFGAWTTWAARKAKLRAAADQISGRWRGGLTRNVLLEWRGMVGRRDRKARLQVAAARQWRRLRLVRTFAGWRAIAGRLSSLRAKETNVAHRQRQLALSSVLSAWRVTAKAQRRKGDAWAGAVHHHRANTLVACLSEWLTFTARKRQAAVARDYATSRLTAAVLLAWQDAAGAAVRRREAARQLAMRAAQRERAEALSTCLRAWRLWAAQMRGAARILRRLLVTTLGGAFSEWRAVAAEGAYWRRARRKLRLHLDEEPSASEAMQAALLRWTTWPAAPALQGWAIAASKARRARELAAAADRLRWEALGLRALVGFGLAVWAAAIRRTAEDHYLRRMRQSVLLAWSVAAREQRVEERQLAAAVLLYTQKLLAQALAGWAQRTAWAIRKREMLVAAAALRVRSATRRALTGWRDAAAYLAPLRQAVEALAAKVRRRITANAFAEWKAAAAERAAMRALLLRAAMRFASSRLATGFAGWREAAAVRRATREMLQHVASRLRHRSALRALNRWREYAGERVQLRAKAQEVLKHMVLRRLYAGFWGWRAAATERSQKRAAVQRALLHWGRAWLARAFNTWAEEVQDAREKDARAREMASRLSAALCRRAVSWWHDYAQYLHHHRAVLAYFHARHLRTVGATAFAAWAVATHWLGLERKADRFRATHLGVRALGGWLIAQHQARMARAAAHRDVYVRRAVMARAWREGVAAVQRKRALTAAAEGLAAARRARRSLERWACSVDAAHSTKLALHWRVRRLGSTMLRHWAGAAQMLREDRQRQQEIALHLATTAATNTLHCWQATSRASRHRRAVLAASALASWRWWAAAHAAKERRVAEAAVQLGRGVMLRVFCSWRWYTQLRVMKEVAFAHKQRAIRQALDMGDQIIRRRTAATLAAALTAWRVQTAKYRRVADRLAGMLELSLRSAMAAWRGAADAARLRRVRAERMAATATGRRVLAALREAVAAGKERDEEGYAQAEALWFASCGGAALAAWRAAAALARARRAALACAIVAAHEAARHSMVGAALDAWRERAARRASIRAGLIKYVNHRRLAVLGEYLSYWRGYAAAMRADAAAALAAGGALPALLAPRSAHEDRRLIRRMALLQGGIEVDRGSDDDAPSLVEGLPATQQAFAAAARAERFAPFCQLSPAYAHRRITREGRPQYDDAAGRPGSAPSPAVDLRSVAESMRQLGRLPPWELPSVRSPQQPHLSVDDLRTYRHRYPSPEPLHTRPGARLARATRARAGARRADGCASDEGTYGGTEVGARWEEGPFIFQTQRGDGGAVAVGRWLPWQQQRHSQQQQHRQQQGASSEDILAAGGSDSGRGGGGSTSSDARAAATRRREPMLQALGLPSPLVTPSRRTAARSPPQRWVGNRRQSDASAGCQMGHPPGRPSQQQRRESGGRDPAAQPVFSLAAWEYVR